MGLGWQKDATGNVDLMKTILDGPTSHGFDYFYGITASLDIPPYVYIENNKVTATAIDSIAASPGPAFWREGPIGNDFKHAEVLPHLTQKAVDYIGEQQKGKKPFFSILHFLRLIHPFSLQLTISEKLELLLMVILC
ncbi:hypothetical protein [Sphingobacterium sp. E70]|uniref:hypothetical protein n=1 Tax=Sphingobacterium sp. E70 TaxID=2853439 RepID=UPI00211C6878|nr:hypothetical protein [Sphingobacterium sp. E70]